MLNLVFGGWGEAGRELYQGLSEGVEIAMTDLTDFVREKKKEWYDNPQAEAEVAKMRASTERVRSLLPESASPRDVVLQETSNLLEDLHDLPEMDGLIGTEKYSTSSPEGLENTLKVIQKAEFAEEMRDVPVDVEMLHKLRAERNFADVSSIELGQILPKQETIETQLEGTGIKPFDLEVYRKIGDNYPAKVEMVEMKVDISDLPRMSPKEFVAEDTYSYFETAGFDTLELPEGVEMQRMRVGLDGPRDASVPTEVDPSAGKVQEFFDNPDAVYGKYDNWLDARQGVLEFETPIDPLFADEDEKMFFADSMEDVVIPSLEELNSGAVLTTALVDSLLTGALELGVNTAIGTVPIVLVDQFVDLFTKTGKWGDQLFHHNLRYLEETEKSAALIRNQMQGMFGTYIELSKKIRAFYTQHPKYCWIRDNGICGQEELPNYSISDLAFVFKKLTKTGLWKRCRIITLEGTAVGLLDDRKPGYNFFLKPADGTTEATFSAGEFGFFFRLAFARHDGSCPALLHE